MSKQRNQRVNESGTHQNQKKKEKERAWIERAFVCVFGAMVLIVNKYKKTACIFSSCSNDRVRVVAHLSIVAHIYK